MVNCLRIYRNTLAKPNKRRALLAFSDLFACLIAHLGHLCPCFRFAPRQTQPYSVPVSAFTFALISLFQPFPAANIAFLH